eukprot:10683867-Lingulodinium_polyedra.AAC.1
MAATRLFVCRARLCAALNGRAGSHCRWRSWPRPGRSAPRRAPAPPVPSGRGAPRVWCRLPAARGSP